MTTQPIPSIPQGTPVLVTGASGFTGSLLTRKLAAAGLDVRAIARGSSRIDHLRDVPITWHVGDIFDPGVVGKAARGVEYIFHVAAAYRQANVSDDFYRQVHVDSTKLLAQAALDNPDFQRFVHVSTIGVHGHVEHPPADENAPFDADDMYQRTKAEAELWIRDFARDNVLAVSVIRPCAIYGPGDNRLLKLFRLALGPVYPLLGSGPALYHLVHVEDLTNIIILAATHPAAQGEVFIAGNPQATTLEAMGRTIAAAFGQKPRIVRLPAQPFFLLAGLCETVCRPLGLEPPLYKRRVAFYTKNRSFNTAKVQNLLSYRFQVPESEGLVQTGQWYVRQGLLKAKGSK